MESANNTRIIDARAELADAKHDAEALNTSAAATRKATGLFPFITSAGDEKLATAKTTDQVSHLVILTDEDDVNYAQNENTGLWEETE